MGEAVSSDVDAIRDEVALQEAVDAEAATMICILEQRANLPKAVDSEVVQTAHFIYKRKPCSALMGPSCPVSAG